MNKNSIKLNSITNLVAIAGLGIFIICAIMVNCQAEIYHIFDFPTNGTQESYLIQIIGLVFYSALTIDFVFGGLRRIFMISEYTAQLILRDKPVYSGDAKVYLKIISLGYS